jgi:hypothetical protein
VEGEHPDAVRIRRANFPTAKEGAIGRANIEIFPVAASMDKRGVGLANQIGSERAANWVKKSRSGKPAGNSSEERQEEQKNENGTKKSQHIRMNENLWREVPVDS